MEFRIFVEPQHGATYHQLRRIATRAEACGFSAFVCADHYLPTTPSDKATIMVDAWTTLAGLAKQTSTIRLGTLMSPVMFRQPGPLAVIVNQVDVMSGGRIELGLGAGWFEREHDAMGIPFPPMAERFQRLDEQLQVIRGLWSTPSKKRFSFAGKHYALTDVPGLGASPLPDAVPIIVGGQGLHRTPSLAARYGAEFNVPLPTLAGARRAFDHLDRECAEIGRDPRSIVRSVMLHMLVGGTPELTLGMISRAGLPEPEIADSAIVGPPAVAVDTLLNWVSGSGADRIYLHLVDLDDLDQLDLVAGEVLPLVRRRVRRQTR